MWAHAIVKFIQETGPWEEMKAVVLPVGAPWTGSRFLFLVYQNLRLLLASGGLPSSNSDSLAVCTLFCHLSFVDLLPLLTCRVGCRFCLFLGLWSTWTLSSSFASLHLYPLCKKAMYFAEFVFHNPELAQSLQAY
jgi:ABC-type Co2+ transport system permease subunit